MFESVLLPAPFSPSRACTSPAAASKSTRSFATTPGKRFVIPRICTAAPGGAAVLAALVCSSSIPVSGKRVKPAFRLALRAADHALHEPVHLVQVLHGQLLALGDAQLPLLVVQRPGELVELAGLDLLHLLRDRGLRPRAHLRAVRREPGEAVLDRAVVEARLPGAVHRRFHT